MIRFTLQTEDAGDGSARPKVRQSRTALSRGARAFAALNFCALVFGVLVLALATAWPGLAFAQSARVPQFWDVKRKLDRPDLGAIRQIRFLTENDYPPFHFVGPDGQLTGFEVDLARAICDQLQVSCTIQPIRWDGLAAALRAGQGDAIIASMRISAETRQTFAFTAAYFRSPARFVARIADPPLDPSLANLAGRKVAVVTGSAHEAYLKAFYRTVDLVRVPHQTAALEAARAGEVAAAFVDGVTGAFWLNGESSAGCCGFAGGPYAEPRFFGEGAGIALRPDSAVLRQAIDWALHRLAVDGRYAMLYLKYFPVSPF